MRVGLVLPLFSGSPERVLEAARAAEAVGYDGVFVFDHFFPPGAPGDRPSLEAFTMLAAVAEATERVTIGTLVTRASLRPVGLLAKQAAWVQEVSGGRLVLGIGTGDPIDRPEHVAYGIPMLGRAERRAHLREVVPALRALFEGKAVPGGTHLPPMSGPLAPALERVPPMWLGGLAEEVVRMAGTLADGWNGWGLEPVAFAERATLLARTASEHGRTAEPTWAGIVLAGRDEAETEELAQRRRARGLDDEAWVGTTEALAGHLSALAAAGATWAVVVPAGPRDRAEVIAREVLPAVAGAGEPADSVG